MKKIVLFTLVLCVLTSLFACKKEKDPDAGGETAAKDTLNVAVSQDMGTLDPLVLAGQSFSVVSRMYAEPLYDIDADGNYVWILATNIEIISPVQWIIHLREGVKFSNGNPFNAEDVLFSLDRFTNEPSLPYVKPLDYPNCKAIDEYTVEVNFFNYDISNKSNFVYVQMFDKESYSAASYLQSPIGTGPYIVKEYTVNSHCYLSANPGYWNGEPKIKNLHFKVIDEASQVTNNLRAGTVDAATIASQDVSFIQGNSDYKVELLSTGGIDAVIFNNSELSLLSSTDARRAVAHAVDRESIIKLVQNDTAAISTAPISKKLVDFDASFTNSNDVYKVGFDLTLAREYAERAGIIGKTIRIVTNGSANDIKAAQIIANDLKSIGVEYTITNYDMASWFGILVDLTAFDMMVWQISAPSMTAAQTYNGWFGGVGCISEGTWENKAYYAEIADKVSTTFDDAERAGMVKVITEMAAQEVPWFAIDEPQRAVAYNAGLSGVKFMLSGYTNYGDWYWSK